MSIAEMKPIKVYGGPGCIDCVRTKRFLNERQIPYEWYNVATDGEALAFVLKANKGMRSIPTLLFEDGTTLTEPSNRELAKKLGLLV